jgi:hypothetical protein
MVIAIASLLEACESCAFSLGERPVSFRVEVHAEGGEIARERAAEILARVDVAFCTHDRAGWGHRAPRCRSLTAGEDGLPLTRDDDTFHTTVDPVACGLACCAPETSISVHAEGCDVAFHYLGQTGVSWDTPSEVETITLQCRAEREEGSS